MSLTNVMYEEVWAELGIAPTRELAAIKKAYALKLRVTRPDDDAAAYQRLRSAYEWAQQWAKWAREEDEDGDPAEAVEAPPVAAAPVEPAFREAAQDEAFASLTSADLSTWMERLKPQRFNSGPEVLEAWSEIQPQLLAIPLHLHHQASARFADLVIGEPWLPAEIAEALQEHFCWRDDFRAARLLGTGRLQRLHEVLDERIERPITDPAVLSHFAPLQHLQRLRAAGRRLAAFWFAVRLGDPLLQLSLQPNAKQQRQLGMDSEVRPLFGKLLFSAGLVRMGLLWLVLLALYVPALRRGQELGDVGFFCFMAFIAARLMLGVSGLICTASWQGLGLERALGQRWSEWRASTRCTQAGLALMALVACGQFSIPEGGLQVVAWIAWVVGLLLAWPRVTTHATVALGACLVMSLVFGTVSASEEVLAVLLACVPVWVLGGCLLHEMGRQVPLLSVLVRPITNSLHLCDRYGYKFAMAPMLAAVTVRLASRHEGGVTVFVVWSLSILGLGWLQNRLTNKAIQEMG